MKTKKEIFGYSSIYCDCDVFFDLTMLNEFISHMETHIPGFRKEFIRTRGG
ncbi:hypothetical protein [Polynucleobacter sp.]|uniref:hypothetical protein n=1 Tax=Polynucleobacter sp. TaxID=2029855 RepID=UPI003F69F0FB